MITFTRCAFIAKQACATFSQVVQKITPPIANNFLKFFFALFATLTLNAATAWAEEETISFDNCVSNGSGTTLTLTWDDNESCTIKQEKSNAQSNVNSSYQNLPRWYAGHIITFTPKNNCTITKIVISTSSNKNGQDITCVTGSGSITKSGNKTTITGSWDSDLQLKMGTQCQSPTVVITYEKTSTPPTPATITLSEAGVERSITGKNVGEQYELPSTSSQTCGTKTFVGWSTKIIENSPTKPTAATYFEPDASVTLAASQKFYAVFAETGGTPTTSWSKTDIANIKSTDEVAITMSKGELMWALSSSKGTDAAPDAILVEQGNLEFAGALLWNIQNDEGDLTIYPNGTSSKWLYCTNTNNGVRVGTNTDKTFTISGNYLQHTATSRYIGVYTTNPDWRCYDNTTGNIAGQTLAFYKKTTTSGYKNYTTECAQTDCSLLKFTSNIAANQTAAYAQNATANTLTVSAEYDGNSTGVTYQWYSNTTNSNTNGTLITNATSASYKPSTTEVGTTYYYCVATYDDECTITSNVATVTITTPVPTFTVTFDSDGGSAVTGQTIEKGKTATKPENPEKAGHTFVGWYNGDTEFDFDTPITGNITLTAKWEIITYNINYEGLEGATHSNPSTYNVETATITFTTPSNREDYVFKGWTPASIAKGSTGDKTVTAQWIKAHTVTWKGATYNGTQNVVNGDAVGTLPEDVACSDTYTTFIGWYTKSSGVETNPSAEPQGEEVTAETQPTKDVTYYAVWADGSGNTSTVDELTRETTGVSGTSYTSWSGKTSNSLAVYAGQSAGGNNAIQLRSNNSNSGIITTTSGGKATKVSVTWNTNTADDRTLNVYGKNTAYSSPTDLYDNAAGTLIGTIIKGTSTELTISGDYEYIGLRSASGAMYLDKIQITWSSGVDPTGYISSCCQSQAVVTVAPTENELILNIDGTASTTVNISQTGAGNGKYNQPTISPAEGASLNWTGNYKQAPYNLTFTAT